MFEYDISLSRAEKMKLAFGVARKRLEELQKQRKARLPTSLEQRLGSGSKTTPSPDRRLSNAMQSQMYAQGLGQRPDPQAFAGLADSTSNMTLQSGMNGNRQDTSYTTSADLQQSPTQAYSTQVMRTSADTMMGGQQNRPQAQYHSQFQDVDWVRDNAGTLPFRGISISHTELLTFA